MAIWIVYEEKPCCKICGLQMQEWYAFDVEHFHQKCLIENIKRDFRESLKESIDNV